MIHDILTYVFPILIVSLLGIIANRELRVLELEDGIKKHRDMKLDDRCWLDDYDLYSLLHDNLVETDTRLPPREIFLQNCAMYQQCRSVASTPEAAIQFYAAMKASRDGRASQDSKR